jgi:hypothetical protein
MNKPRTIDGSWWIHGDDKQPDFGTLSYDPEEGLRLAVKVRQSRTTAKAMIEAMRKFNKPVEVPSVVHGVDERLKPITLFGCSCIKSAASSGLDSYRIDSLAAILNFRGCSWEKANFSAACVRYTLLSQWINRRTAPEAGPEGSLLCLKVGVNDLVETELSPGIRLKIEETMRPQSSVTDFRIEISHRVWFLFSAPTPAKMLRNDYAFVLLRLLCLLTGRRTFIEEISLYDYDPFTPSDGEQLQASEYLGRNEGVAEARRDVSASQMIAPFEEISSDAGSIFKRWFECHERLRPVVDLYFAIVSNRALIIESRFLFLAQALEVYHARSERFSSTDVPTDVHKTRVKAILQSAPTELQPWLKEKLSYSNQKTLAQRLGEILSLHGNEANRLTAGIADFAAKVRNGRNYYTHYDQKLRQKGKVPEGRELVRITFALKALLEVCLLKELSIKGKPVERILERESSSRCFDMEGASEPPGEPRG